jgi:phage tail-like protein
MKAALPFLMAALISIASGVQGADARSTNPAQGDFLPAHNFKIEIDGVIVGSFREISGIESSVEVIEYRDGDNPVTHKRPGRAKFSNIVMKRQYAGDHDPISEWFRDVFSGKTERKSGSIILTDRAGAEVLRYYLIDAWPARRNLKPEINPLNGRTFIVEEIELAVDWIERSK